MTVVRPKINVNAADQSSLAETTINQSESGGQILRPAQSAGKLKTTCLHDLTYRSSIPHGSSLHRIEVFCSLEITQGTEKPVIKEVKRKSRVF